MAGRDSDWPLAPPGEVSVKMSADEIGRHAPAKVEKTTVTRESEEASWHVCVTPLCHISPASKNKKPLNRIESAAYIVFWW